MDRMIGVVLIGLLTACGGGGDRHDDYDSYADATAAAQAAEAARASVYENYGADEDGTGADPRAVDASDVEDSGNYVCTQDCSGHEAGFAWGQAQDITDASDCSGNSQSFIEGCEAFAQERQELADRESQEAAEQAAEDARAEAEVESDEQGYGWR